MIGHLDIVLESLQVEREAASAVVGNVAAVIVVDVVVFVYHTYSIYPSGIEVKRKTKKSEIYFSRSAVARSYTL